MKFFFVMIGVLFGITCMAQRELDYQDTRRKNESFAKFPLFYLLKNRNPLFLPSILME